MKTGCFLRTLVDYYANDLDDVVDCYNVIDCVEDVAESGTGVDVDDVDSAAEFGSAVAFGFEGRDI